MVAEGGHIDFMFLSPPFTAIGFATHRSDSYQCTNYIAYDYVVISSSISSFQWHKLNIKHTIGTEKVLFIMFINSKLHFKFVV